MPSDELTETLNVGKKCSTKFYRNACVWLILFLLFALSFVFCICLRPYSSPSTRWLVYFGYNLAQALSYYAAKIDFCGWWKMAAIKVRVSERGAAVPVASRHASAVSVSAIHGWYFQAFCNSFVDGDAPLGRFYELMSWKVTQGLLHCASNHPR